MLNLGKWSLDKSHYPTLAKLDYLPTILLFGPPNTGKTTLVYRLFNELKDINNNINLYYLDFSSVMSSEYGGTSKNLVSAFDSLTSDCSIENPKILLIDEIDQFCMSRSKDNEHDASRRAMTSLMLELDHLHPSNIEGLIVIAISNVESMLDPAIVRRFNLKISIKEQLKFDDFKTFLQDLGQLFPNVNFKDEYSNLYEIYKEKRLTVPDIKGCFRDAVSSTSTIEEITEKSVIEAFNNSYSSIINDLE